MSQLDCEVPDIKLVKPNGLSDRLFFQAYCGPNAIAFAHLSSRCSERRKYVAATAEFAAPAVSYHLRKIEVSQHYRNKGVGSALLREVIKFCKEERVGELFGEAVGNRGQLRHWYREQGFDLDDVDNIHMSFDT